MSAYHSRIPPESAADDAAEATEPSPGADHPADSVGQAVANLSALVAELKDYLGYYAAAKLDGIKWSMTRLGLLAVLGVVGLLIASAALVAATVLFLVGLANGIGRAFDPDMIWLGWVIMGGAVLLVTGVGGWLAMLLLTRGTKKRMAEKYENKRRRQQAERGTNVRDRAAGEPGSVGPA